MLLPMLLVLLLPMLLVLLLPVLLVFVLLVLLQLSMLLLPKGACVVTLLPTNRAEIEGVTYPRKVISLCLVHYVSCAEAFALKTLIVGCSMK